MKRGKQVKKFISKIKKVVILIIGTIIALPSKIYAMMYTQTEILYGPPVPSKSELLLGIGKVLCIPIILLIGIIVYLTKKKTSTRNKVLIILAFIIIMAILYCIINAINSNIL